VKEAFLMPWGMCHDWIPNAAISCIPCLMLVVWISSQDIKHRAEILSVALEQEHTAVSACCCVHDPYTG